MDKIDRLIAIEDIKTLKARYFRGVDQKDAVLLRRVFAADAVADFRGAATDPQNGVNAVPDSTTDPLHGRETIVESIIGSVTPLVTVHHGSIPEIEIVDEHNATAIWPMVDWLRMPAGWSVSEMVGFGHYDETYVREDGAWRIKTMKLTRLRVDNTLAPA